MSENLTFEPSEFAVRKKYLSTINGFAGLARKLRKDARSLATQSKEPRMRSKHALLSVASAAALSALSSNAMAAPCGTTVLSNWLASGFSCTIGDKTFSNFLYNPDGFNVPASSVGVTPVGAGTNNPGILFNGGWQNTGTTNLDATIGFTVTAPTISPITDASLAVSGILPGTTFRDVETLSNGVQLIATDTNPGPITATFAPLTTLSQIEDLTVFPGGNGAIVGLSLITKTVSQTPTPPPPVPEPGSLALLGTMLAGFGWLGRRSRMSL